MKNLLHSKDLSKREILSLLDRAEEFLETVHKRKRLKLADGKILAALFYEPSTRTRFSFETAMLRLGGEVISNEGMNETSSAKKGETLYDTGRVVSQMADIIAMRHPEPGSALELVEGARVPVVNAGDGPGDHPTQGLLDLFTIRRALGRLDDFTIVMVGDLRNSRVVHSQCELLMNFKGVRFILVSPEALRLPRSIFKELSKKFKVEETDHLEAAITGADVLSHTRIQKERFSTETEYKKYKGVYVLTPALMKKAPDSMIVIHPLPRVDEIDMAVDKDPRARYFEQVENGVAVRMAILSELLGL